MRGLWLIFLIASACSDNHLPPAVDGGALDLARPAGDLAGPRHDLAAIDLAGPPSGQACAAVCNRCQNGPCCGSLCCNAGEWCDATNTCRCGSGAACSGNLICATGGPIMPGGNTCGFICCGDSTHPCPL